MKIRSNIEINENKWKEFLYVFFKENEDEVYIEINENTTYFDVKVSNTVKNISYREEKIIENQEDIILKTSLLKLYNKILPWGSLVGVRPTKLVRKLLEKYSYEEIENILEKVYMVTNKKSKLLINVVKNSIEYIDNDTIGIYIGLAFCPTKCTYCSFPAYLKKGKYLERYNEYFNTIIKEIDEMSSLCNELNLPINTIYVGGGTPSFLDYNELNMFLKHISKFNMENISEYTFEAGRIDTLDRKKLEILKEYGVTRISINPQSFKDSTLKLVNRYHNIEKLNEVYKDSKELDFEINMDFIIGLPKEDTQDVLNTIKELENYEPDNITFHYLAMKKASYLTKNNYFFDKELDYKLINDKIYEVMEKRGYIPYYLYRQKSSSIEGENVGFCKPNKQLIYNIEMIEENKTIISIGAGAITKIITDRDITRLINAKDPLMWVDEFEEKLNQKKEYIRGVYGKEKER